jgi:tetratricopeptide (TPR) repeat protein
MLTEARNGLQKRMRPDSAVFGALEMQQAQLALARADLLEARDGLRRAIAIFDAAPEKNSGGLRALTLLARTEQQLGELDAAQAHANLAVATARKTMAGFAHSAWLGSALVAQGLVQRARGEAVAAQASWREALVELQEGMGDAAPPTAEVRRLLAGS